MAARNDITGAEIKTRVLSNEGYANWDNIFGPKKTAFEWLDCLHPGVRLRNADGWPGNDGVWLDTPISRNDFDYRFTKCSVK